MRRSIPKLVVAVGLLVGGSCAENGVFMWECGNGRQEGSEQCDDGNGVAGDGCSGFCTLEDVEPGIEPTLASIQRFVFTPICSVCHWPAGTGQFMHLHTEDASYENLVLIDYSFLCSGRRVEPGNPDASCLVLKLEGSSQAGGERMPSGGAPPLTAEQIGAIRQWILDGAPR